MHAYVKEELAKVEARMFENMNAFKSEMRGEMHTLEMSMYTKWREEMQTYEGKSQKEMTTQFKVELGPLEGKIHVFMAKDMLKLVKEVLKAEGKAVRATKDKEIAELKVQVEACKQEVPTVVENEIQKSKEAIAAMEASVSKVQENVEEVHTWAEMAKDAKQKEEAKHKVRTLRIRVVGWEEDAAALSSKLGTEESLVLNAWRVGDVVDKSGHILMLKFEDMGKKNAFLAKCSTSKSEKIYLDEDLYPRPSCTP
ncbi:hypothetical protein L7F22_044620 [Adiantum nelumboides]|nr:hypothetical protein [Adiantum nelumboides]